MYQDPQQNAKREEALAELTKHPLQDAPLANSVGF